MSQSYRITHIVSSSHDALYGGRNPASSLGDGMRVTQVVIVGGGTAGWMAACAIARFLGQTGCSVTLVESQEIGTIGVGEATIPPITKFLSSIGLSVADLLATTGATFKLAIKFNGWTRDGESYLHPFGSLGSPIEGVNFRQLYLRVAGLGRCGPIWQYAPCAVASTLGKFAPATQIGSSSILSFPHAYHLDANHFAASLRSRAESLGVKRVEGRIVDVLRAGSGGTVGAVVLDDGRHVAGDLFIDCSGARGLLIGTQPGNRFLDWGELLPCDRAAVLPSTRINVPDLFTEATARSAGWQWRIPLQHRDGNGYVFASAFSSDEDAIDELIANLSPDRLAEPRIIPFRTGRRTQFWQDNVVAIGLSGGFLEPLESTSIHLSQLGITQLLSLWPDRNFASSLATIYNARMARAFENARDFVLLHYKMNRREGAFWQRMREAKIPDTLAHRISLFSQTGNIDSSDDDIFSAGSWFAVLLGQGVIPQRYSPLADNVALTVLDREFARMRSTIAHEVAKMPYHADFLPT